jgi:hypothetical protein
MQLEVRQDEAAQVKLAFELAVDGLTVRQIAEKLGWYPAKAGRVLSDERVLGYADELGFVGPAVVRFEVFKLAREKLESRRNTGVD